MSRALFASYRATRFAAAGQSLNEAVQHLERLVKEINTLDETSLEMLATELPEYGKVKRYLDTDMGGNTEGLEGPDKLPLIFKAVLLNKIKKMQGEVDGRLSESTSREELVELKEVASKLDTLESLINANISVIRKVQQYDTREQGPGQEAEIHGANLYKVLEQFIREKGKGDLLQQFVASKNKQKADQLKEQEWQEFVGSAIDDAERNEFLHEYFPREKRKMTGKRVPQESAQDIGEIKRNFEQAVSLVDEASDSLEKYSDFLEQVMHEASSPEGLTVYREVRVPMGGSLEDVITKVKNFGTDWYTDAGSQSAPGKMRGERLESYLIEARVPASSIDEKKMRQVYDAPNGPHGQAVLGEVYLKKDAPLRLIEISNISGSDEVLTVPVDQAREIRAENIGDYLRIAAQRFADYVQQKAPEVAKTTGPVTEDRKSAPESAAGASPLTHGAVDNTVTSESGIYTITAKAVKGIRSRFGW